MKKSKFSDSQIVHSLERAWMLAWAFLTYAEKSASAQRRFTNGGHNLAAWTPSLMARMKELEEANRRLKKMYVEEKLKAEIAAEYPAKK